MSDHPYRHLPSRAFWSRSVAADWDARTLIAPGTVLLRAADRIISAGSCFASNIVHYLEQEGYTYVRSETLAASDADRFGYGHYSAAYGNIYTARQLLQLVQRIRGAFKPVEDRWYAENSVIDPFRPGLRYPAETDNEFDVLTATHLAHTRQAIEQASIFVFTLGLTEAWVSARDGAVFPACPGTVAGSFDPALHLFKNFDVQEVIADLNATVAELRALHPGLRLILTVSPVPLVATMTDNHVLCATTFSKSVLRAACEHVARTNPDVIYFPAYEIIMGPQAPDYFEADRRSVSRTGVEAVMGVFLAHSERPINTDSLAKTKQYGAVPLLSQALMRAECEETMVDPQLSSREG